jgi:hypothetical protein
MVLHPGPWNYNRGSLICPGRNERKVPYDAVTVVRGNVAENIYRIIYAKVGL